MRHLDGNESLQLVIVCQVDQAITALAQQPLYPVAANNRWDIDFRRIGFIRRAGIFNQDEGRKQLADARSQM